MSTNPMVRLPFYADLPVSEQIVTIPSVRRANPADWRHVVRAFNRHGFAVLRCINREDSRADLCALKQQFGQATPHPRADQDGIVPINSAVEVKGFLGSTNAEHLLHTDGAYADCPEKIMTLQCVTPSTHGGNSVLVSAQAAYDYLATRFPDQIDVLSGTSALTIERNGQGSTQPLFRRVGARYMVKFRMSDGAARVRPSAAAATLYRALCVFLSSPYNRLEFRLQTGDILVVDNTIVLHGRNEFPREEIRDMRRLNFDATGPLCREMLFGFVPSTRSSTY